MLSRTRFGRYTHAMGGDPVAARRAGVRVALNTTLVFALMGVATWLASTIVVGQLESAQPYAAPTPRARRDHRGDHRRDAGSPAARAASAARCSGSLHLDPEQRPAQPRADRRVLPAVQGQRRCSRSCRRRSCCAARRLRPPAPARGRAARSPRRGGTRERRSRSSAVDVAIVAIPLERTIRLGPVVTHEREFARSCACARRRASRASRSATRAACRSQTRCSSWPRRVLGGDASLRAATVDSLASAALGSPGYPRAQPRRDRALGHRGEDAPSSRSGGCSGADRGSRADPRGRRLLPRRALARRRRGRAPRARGLRASRTSRCTRTTPP